jgi:ADP-dependent NAD(P)H-hydrate dehydratase
MTHPAQPPVPDPRWITALPALPIRPSDGHKGTFGTVIVAGGSLFMPGAPALAATAALRIGAGLCKVLSSRAALGAILPIQPSCTGLPWDAAAPVQATLDLLESVDPYNKAIIAFGPGLGLEDHALLLLKHLLKGKRPIVLDADGLTLLSRHIPYRIKPGPSLVLTPHPGEFSRLAKALEINLSPIDSEERPAAAGALARALSAVVVLKGQHSVVTDGTHFYLNQTGNPAMATAGSGDVLTGVISGLIAQGLPTLDAAILGAHLHGLAGDLWAADHGDAGLLAMELTGRLPAAMHAHNRDAKTKRLGPRGRSV